MYHPVSSMLFSSFNTVSNGRDSVSLNDAVLRVDLGRFSVGDVIDDVVIRCVGWDTYVVTMMAQDVSESDEVGIHLSWSECDPKRLLPVR